MVGGPVRSSFFRFPRCLAPPGARGARDSLLPSVLPVGSPFSHSEGGPSWGRRRFISRTPRKRGGGGGFLSSLWSPRERAFVLRRGGRWRVVRERGGGGRGTRGEAVVRRLGEKRGWNGPDAGSRPRRLGLAPPPLPSCRDDVCSHRRGGGDVLLTSRSRPLGLLVPLLPLPRARALGHV